MSRKIPCEKLELRFDMFQNWNLRGARGACYRVVQLVCGAFYIYYIRRHRVFIERGKNNLQFVVYKDDTGRTHGHAGQFL